MNTNPNFSVIGIYSPVTTEYAQNGVWGGLSQAFYRIIKLNDNSKYGLFFGGWSWNFTGDKVIQNSICILSLDSHGKYQITTPNFTSDPITNGVGAVIVEDFNSDGISDIILPAHNEGPLVATPGVAYLSNNTGKYDKYTLPGRTMAHDAVLFYVDGKPHIATSTFTPGDVNPIYYFASGGFQEFIPNKIASTSNMIGMTISVGEFAPEKNLEYVTADVYYRENEKWIFKINVFDFEKLDIQETIPKQVITPYLSTLPDYSSYPSAYGVGSTHTYRMWKDDLNHDGNLDLIAAQSMWGGNVDYPSALQILINDGIGKFRDQTAELNPLTINFREGDYQPLIYDVDKSGINTFFFSGAFSFEYSINEIIRNPAYTLLNDGTGRLYVDNLKLFRDITPELINFIQSSFPNGNNYSVSGTPMFMALPQEDLTINYIACIPILQTLDGNLLSYQKNYIFVNLPIQYNPTKDFSQNIAVRDRNQSMLLRTWAGNDTFTDLNANTSPTHLDGGLGIDTSIYSSTASMFNIAHNPDNSFMVSGNGLADTLINIERLQFADTNVALDFNNDGHASITAKILGSVFGKQSIENTLYAGIGLDLLDKGMTYDALLNLALTVALGSARSNESVVNLLYTNLVGTAPSQTALNEFVDLIKSKEFTQVSLARFAADLELNTRNIDLVGLSSTGLEFTPVA